MSAIPLFLAITFGVVSSSTSASPAASTSIARMSLCMDPCPGKWDTSFSVWQWILFFVRWSIGSNVPSESLWGMAKDFPSKSSFPGEESTVTHPPLTPKCRTEEVPLRLSYTWFESVTLPTVEAAVMNFPATIAFSVDSSYAFKE